MRIDINKYFIDIAKVISERSTCLKRQVGAVITKDNSIVSTGYNGAARGLEHCCDLYNECPRVILGAHRGERYDICNSVHAELNALLQASKLGHEVQGGVLYVLITPCINCARAIINADISEVVVPKSGVDKEKDTESLKLFERTKVKFTIVEGE